MCAILLVMKARSIRSLVVQQSEKPFGRILVFTGARQTGKTTLCRKLFPEYQYLSIEDPVLRARYAQLTAQQWKDLYPRAILDEVQKQAELVESIKSVYDQWEDPRYILTGSSQLLLLDKVRESLAGRCSIIELYPLTLPELRSSSFGEEVPESLFQRCLSHPESLPDFLPSSLMDPLFSGKRSAWDHYLRFGGYPALTRSDLSDDDRYLWLRNYVSTYLERDIRDLASFRDLEPFVLLQRYLALNTATLVNVASIATHVGVTAKTVQRYLRYFELSYQAFLLPAWSKNESRRLSKASKVHYLDHGILQGVLARKGGVSGPEFESLVVSEMFKQSRIIDSGARFYHVRTHDGGEVDLLIELVDGYFAIEIKRAERVALRDTGGLRNLSAILDKPLLHSFVVSSDPETRSLLPGITAINGAYFLG